MRRFKIIPSFLALTVVSAMGSAALYAQEDERVNSPNAVHEQSEKHSKDVVKVLTTLGTVETVYDYLTFGVSGPVVVLQGFTVNGALRDDAKAQIQKLKWVTHVVQEVELLDLGPELKRVRRQTLGILKKQVPQAFPANHANIRIKATLKGDVTLVGVVDAADKKRLAAAVEQIKHITFVGSVTNNIVEKN